MPHAQRALRLICQGVDHASQTPPRSHRDRSHPALFRGQRLRLDRRQGDFLRASRCLPRCGLQFHRHGGRLFALGGGAQGVANRKTILGEWFKARGNRDKVVLATKIGCDMGPGRQGLSRQRIIAGVEDSLKRLQTDYIDLYQTHFDDEKTPVEETLEAYGTLIKAGKVRCIGTSNMSVPAPAGIPRGFPETRLSALREPAAGIQSVRTPAFRKRLRVALRQGADRRDPVFLPRGGLPDGQIPFAGRSRRAGTRRKGRALCQRAWSAYPRRPRWRRRRARRKAAPGGAGLVDGAPRP